MRSNLQNKIVKSGSQQKGNLKFYQSSKQPHQKEEAPGRSMDDEKPTLVTGVVPNGNATLFFSQIHLKNKGRVEFQSFFGEKLPMGFPKKENPNPLFITCKNSTTENNPKKKFIEDARNRGLKYPGMSRLKGKKGQNYLNTEYTMAHITDKSHFLLHFSK